MSTKKTQITLSPQGVFNSPSGLTPIAFEEIPTINAAELKVGSKDWQETVVRAAYNTDDWQKFVLGLLKSDELVEGFPSTPGLHRISRLLFSSIDIRTSILKCPTSDDRSATAHAEVVASMRGEDGLRYMRFSSSADVYQNNTKEPFCNHPVATAETKAIGRALKLLMNLKIHTHEEMLDDQISYDKVEERQVKSIRSLCTRLKIDINKFLAVYAGVDTETFIGGNSGLSKADGVRLLETLNNLQNKGVPDSLKSTEVESPGI